MGGIRGQILGESKNPLGIKGAGLHECVVLTLLPRIKHSAPLKSLYIKMWFSGVRRSL